MVEKKLFSGKHRVYINIRKIFPRPPLSRELIFLPQSSSVQWARGVVIWGGGARLSPIARAAEKFWYMDLFIDFQRIQSLKLKDLNE